MKQYPTTAFTNEIWRGIDFLFYGTQISNLLSGVVPDGIQPAMIETTKRGVEITGKIHLLPSSSYSLHLCLCRPGFPTVESVTVNKLRASEITDAGLEGKNLTIRVMAAADRKDDT